MMNIVICGRYQGGWGNDYLFGEGTRRLPERHGGRRIVPENVRQQVCMLFRILVLPSAYLVASTLSLPNAAEII